MKDDIVNSTSAFDVVSLGSTMIRFSVPPGERLETASTYDVRTAGSESNTMVALARMGKRTAWVSRLNDNALGRRISNEIGYHGVDTSHVVWTKEDRNETFFVEYGSSPRPTQVIYDRTHSAISALSLEDIDLDFLLRGRIVHLTGILAALSDRCIGVMHAVLDAAKNAGLTVSFDVNYRSKLWSTAEAREVLTPMLKKADILLVTKEDAEDVFDISGTPEEIVIACRDQFGPQIAVVTLGAEGGIAYDGETIYRSGGYKVEVVDRLGAGDCFTAGVLCGYLEGSIQTGMEYASAMAAIKLGIHGDYFVSNPDEVRTLMDGPGGREIGR